VTDTAALLDEPAPRAWYRRTIVWAVAALLALAAAGAWYWQGQETASAAPRYTTEPVRRGNLTLTVTANGTLQPTRSIAIGSELSGTVSKVNVDVNDRVKKGQVLVELDTSKLKDQILRSRATLAAGERQVAQTVATVKEAQATLGRYEEVRGCRAARCRRKPSSTTAHATLERAQADQAAARAASLTRRRRCPPTRSTCRRPRSRAPADG
jgi:HlyD family secretion protein